MRLDPATRRIAAVVVVGALLSLLDGTMVGVGLETIARDLGAGLAGAQWVAHGYLLALAVSLPACGWLARRIGAGRLWLLALAGFTLASALCAAAPTLGLLVAARVVQGLAAGLLVPAGQTLLGQAVGPRRLGRVMAVLASAVSVGPALGPVLGGLVVEGLSWPWLFLVNLPIGAAGLVAGLRVLPRGEPRPTDTLDVVGLVLAGVGLSALVYGVTAWGAAAGHRELALPLAVGALGLGLFVRRTLRHPRPLTDLRLFADRGYAAATACATLTGAALFGSLLLFPLLFQLERGASVIVTGLWLVGHGLGTAVAAPLAGRLTDRLGGARVALAGCAGLVATTVPFALVDLGPLSTQVLLVLRGAAIGFAAVPPTVAAYAAVRPDQLPDATTQLNALQRVGGAVGGALVATVLAATLPAGTRPAFAAAFWCLTAVSVFALAGALLVRGRVTATGR
jgi:EmrB/QacA subfamily drug resistance transporter